MATEAIRTDTVERFTGDLTKLSAFLLRFDGRARKHKHMSVCDGAKRNWAGANIAAFAGATEQALKYAHELCALDEPPAEVQDINVEQALVCSLISHLNPEVTIEEMAEATP